jgi:Myb-like DNA-binding domain
LRKINPATNKADFTESESATIIEQRASGQSWSEISKCLTNRTADQVKLYHEKINPSRKKSKWSPAEDDILLSAQSRFGNKWLLITETLPGRSSNDVKNRWNLLARHQNAATSPLPLPDAA